MTYQEKKEEDHVVMKRSDKGKEGDKQGQQQKIEKYTH